MKIVGEPYHKTMSGRKLLYQDQMCACGDVIGVRKGLKPKTCKPCTKRAHGMVKSPEYNSWDNMKQRCHNPNQPAYPDYGGRGIQVCSEWRASFASFLLDMGRKPTPSHSIERVDNGKGYTPDNCTWATRKEQVNNRRKRKGSSRYRGVYIRTEEVLVKWRAVVADSTNGVLKKTNCGSFLTEEEAARAYDD
ncbi:MAG: hypothetical protein HRT61_19945, partial [Ekhidna sp.]|nr:hypothetical protein [Ekhidna sp.]